MARSGNVDGGILGQILLVGKMLDGATTSDHLLRFTPNQNKINLGYLTAFLMSDLCKGQLLRNAAGAVIPSIRPAALKNLQIPLLNIELQKRIGEMIVTAVEDREKAISLLVEARSLVLQYNNLPHVSEEQIEILGLNKETEIRFNNQSGFTDDFRLDAHFYNPMAKLIVSNIVEFTDRFKNLFNVAECTFKGSRAIRNYVEKDHGIPFLSGKNIVQIRPDFKYISKTETSNLNEMIVKQNQILISRSGTLGRTIFVWKNYEGFAASEHLIRVISNSKLIDPAYLYAFLSTEYGYYQLLRYKHGSVIDEITEDQISKSVIPIPSEKKQNEIGNLVRQAYDMRVEAIRLEDEAQDLLTKALTKNN